MRRSTNAAVVPLVGGLAALTTAMSQLRDKRISFRLPIVTQRSLVRTVDRAIRNLCAIVLDNTIASDKFVQQCTGL
jgi:hypothetical protein